jgi:ornithine decarboxylase
MAKKTILSVSECAQIKKAVLNNDTPFLLLDKSLIKSGYQKLKKFLPSVTMYYALKALSDINVIEVLNGAGSFFDIASTGEIEVVKNAGIGAEKCLYSHPCKKDSDIESAINFGCKEFVFDNEDELYKFLPYSSQITLILRVAFDNNKAVVELSKKFGCETSIAMDLLKKAKEMGLKVEGVAFHVGSQSIVSEVFCRAIEFCNSLIEDSKQNNIANITTLDIGGGFPVEYKNVVVDYDNFFSQIRESLKILPDYIRVIAEPGRILVAPSVTAVSSVVGFAKRNNINCYYLDDGLYGSYSGALYDHANYCLTYLKNSEIKHNCNENSNENSNTQMFVSMLFGPTCDSIDVVSNAINLPKLSKGDFIIGRNMGAYTLASATDFNRISKPKIVIT